MPSSDARVYIALQQRRVPFSYRFFNTYNPYLQALIPDWAPEFTLKDYKVVIVVLGSFFGGIPAMIDRTSLAKAILEKDGWKFFIWSEFDVSQDVDKLLSSVPELRKPRVTGPVYRNPLGQPDVMAAFRRLTARRHYYVSASAVGLTRSRRRQSHVPGFTTQRKLRDYSAEALAYRNRRLTAQRRRKKFP